MNVFLFVRGSDPFELASVGHRTIVARKAYISLVGDDAIAGWGREMRDMCVLDFLNRE